MFKDRFNRQAFPILNGVVQGPVSVRYLSVSCQSTEAILESATEAMGAVAIDMIEAVEEAKINLIAVVDIGQLKLQ